jgi:hypothetical protein
MFITYDMLWRLALFIIGIWWCVEVSKRLRDDISLVRDPAIEGTRKGVVIGIWAGTALLLFMMIFTAVGIVARWIHSVNHPLG